MELTSHSQKDHLIEDQVKTAHRTHQLLAAARLVFAFSHGCLVFVTSLVLRWELDTWWYVVFTPVWIGNAVCLLLIIVSWFASCPYVQLCLRRHQVRMGVKNPSILTEVLPEIVAGVLSLIVVTFALVAEIMLCAFLDDSSGKHQALLPSAIMIIFVATISCCYGICIKSSGIFYGLLGSAIVVTIVIALCMSHGLTGPRGWVMMLPTVFFSLAIFLYAVRKLQRYRKILSREEHHLRIIEQILLGGICLASLSIMISLFLNRGHHIDSSGHISLTSSIAGALAGIGICGIAMLRWRMAYVESQQSPLRDRLTLLKAQESQADLRGASSNANGPEKCFSATTHQLDEL